jgi:NAD(P)-dependent dehydrogenase (short-subunit alcohol dehydrogenase family)
MSSPFCSAALFAFKAQIRIAKPARANYHFKQIHQSSSKQLAKQFAEKSHSRPWPTTCALMTKAYSTAASSTKPEWILPPDGSSIQERLASCAGKVAVVTGGARGIGGQIALGLAEAGAQVAIVDVLEKPPPEAFAVLKKVCPDAKYYCTDVANPDEVASSFAAIVHDFKEVNIFVSAAGVIREKPFVDVTADELMFQINVNMVGTFLTSQQAGRQMVKQGKGGSILVIASMGSHRALRDQFASCYVMTKWGLRGWVKQVAMELGEHDIRVNSLSPGYTQTAMAIPLISPERAVSWPYISVLNRMGRADELKAPAVFLCSDAASYITGTDLLNDGGATCY